MTVLQLLHDAGAFTAMSAQLVGLVEWTGDLVASLFPGPYPFPTPNQMVKNRPANGEHCQGWYLGRWLALCGSLSYEHHIRQCVT